MTANNERQAEIEAVAAAHGREMFVSHNPHKAARAAIEALDRARDTLAADERSKNDARHPDNLAPDTEMPRTRRVPARRRSPQGEDARERVARETLEWMDANRPQGEDHEAGIEAAMGAYVIGRPGLSVGRGAMESAIAAYLSRSSPARDARPGTTTAEDVWWWLAKNCRSPALAAAFRAEFAPDDTPHPNEKRPPSE